VTADALLPQDGELLLGQVRLPSGERVHALGPGRPADPVAWVTSGPVPEPGLTWSELSGISSQTGLIPFIADNLYEDEPDRPWRRQSSDLNYPSDPALADLVDVHDFLQHRWEELAHIDENDEEWRKEEIEEEIAPFGVAFPGLASVATDPLAPEELNRVLQALPPARIGLTIAGRPADALAATGWGASDQYPDGMPMTAVLRSWEDRFGTRLLRIGMHEFTVLAGRLPRTVESAQKLAAEHWAFADECTCGNDDGPVSVSDLASRVVTTPIWGFWWD
jgi:hypothetical protein